MKTLHLLYKQCTGQPVCVKLLARPYYYLIEEDPTKHLLLLVDEDYFNWLEEMAEKVLQAPHFYEPAEEK